MHGTGRTETGTEIIDTDDEKTIGIQRLAGPDHIVPPATCASIISISTSNMMRGIQCMTHQHRIGTIRIERTVGFIYQCVIGKLRAALQWERCSKKHRLWRNNS